MKQLFFIVTLFSGFISRAQLQWSNPQPSGYGNAKVVFTDAQNGYIMNGNGDLIRTVNQGISWAVQQNLPRAATIDYKDSTFVAGGVGFVYVSTDGQSWAKRPVGIEELVDIVQVVSRDTIFATRTQTTHLHKSVDRGQTWQVVNSDIYIKSFWMINALEGFAVSYGGIYKTTNGGANWQLQQSGQASAPTFIKFRDENHGVAFGPNSVLWKTANGGASWNTTSSSHPWDPTDAAFLDADTVFSVTQDGALLRSKDGGLNWQVFSIFPIDPIYLCSVHFVNVSTGFMVGLRGSIFKTTDAGLSWTKYAPTYNHIGALDFPTQNVGYATDWNNIYKTTDAGQVWTKLGQTTPTISERYRQIHFFNKDTGIALSETPVRLFKTKDGGVNWQTVNLGSNEYILGTAFHGDTIYLTTHGPIGNKVLLSMNAGDSWTVRNNDYNIGYNNPFFTTSATGYAPNFYTIQKTVDYGTTWAPVFTQNIAYMRHISFVDPFTGFVCGDQSYIAKTVDSGHTWTRLYIDPNNSNVPGDLKQVEFFNKKIGYVISDDKLFRSTSGGDSWMLLKTFPLELNGIKFTPDSNVVIYGENGAILKSPIKTVYVDSLKTDSLNSCKVRLTARITAVLTTIDSVWVEYGTSTYNNQFTMISPGFTDTSLKVSLPITGLSQGTAYKARFKIFYGGGLYYSDSLTFNTISQATPVISFSGGFMHSSIQQGNQWFLNQLAIAGATGSSYMPTQPGSYTVHVLLANGCASPMSAPYVHSVTAINDPVMAKEVLVYPNPVTEQLTILNQQLKKLDITVINSLGMKLMQQRGSSKDIHVKMETLPAGVYLVCIRDVNNSRQYQKMVVKL